MVLPARVFNRGAIGCRSTVLLPTGFIKNTVSFITVISFSFAAILPGKEAMTRRGHSYHAGDSDPVSFNARASPVTLGQCSSTRTSPSGTPADTSGPAPPPAGKARALGRHRPKTAKARG